MCIIARDEESMNEVEMAMFGNKYIESNFLTMLHASLAPPPPWESLWAVSLAWSFDVVAFLSSV